ncbi:hypothetical protein L0Y40_00545 [Candidatus Wolfebacteria bacterium]|nr:hypothetical protein [Candidatus Wolfebacteria bacterium]
MSQGVLSIGAVVIVLALSSFLNPNEFGGTRYLIAVFAILSFFSLPGVGSVVINHLPLLNRRGLWHGIVAQIRWGLGATVGALLIAVYYLGFTVDNNDLAFGFLVGGVLAPVANLYLMPGTVLAGLKRFKAKMLVDGLIIALTAGGAAYGASATQTITGTILCYYATQLLLTAVALLLVIRLLPAHAAERSHRSTTDVRYGKQLTFFQVPFTLLPSLEKAFVFILLGPTALAVFAIAVIPAEHMKNAVRNLLQFYMLPHLKERGAGTWVFDVKKWFTLSTGLSVVATAALLLAVFFLMPILFPHYESAHALAVILSFTVLLLPFQVFTVSWVAAQRVGTLFTYAFSVVLINVLTFVFLLPLLGLQGAIVAKIVFEILAASVAVVLHFGRNGFS